MIGEIAKGIVLGNKIAGAMKNVTKTGAKTYDKALKNKGKFKLSKIGKLGFKI